MPYDARFLAQVNLCTDLWAITQVVAATVIFVTPRH